MPISFYMTPAISGISTRDSRPSAVPNRASRTAAGSVSADASSMTPEPPGGTMTEPNRYAPGRSRMTQPPLDSPILKPLNPPQRAAATHGEGPLLIVAGAGTGKTATLVHRVAWLIARGVAPQRILLVTFTRRAAAEMLRRVDHILLHLERLAAPGAPRRAGRVWGGTFHAVATRLLRRYGRLVGLQPDFTVHDRSDSEDLMNVVRAELGLAKNDKRFPKKGTCMAIYSRCVNAREKLDDALQNHFPWCRDWKDALRKLFDAYVDRKEAAGVLDYDDLLIYWNALLADARAGNSLRALFDHVLVDEYQDTNALQGEIVRGLCPEGRGLTVVGDDAQSIYAFRAATVRNILDFPGQFPGTTIVTLEQNYRSTVPILDATNAVIGLASERHEKTLWSERAEGARPQLVQCFDEDEQTEQVIRRILAHREGGVDLRRQAVLFRASHHSMLLEAELARRGIPFHKYGGLKFVEAAHVKDLLAILRLAENPRDLVSGMRLLVLLPGIGPATARRLMEALVQAGGRFEAWRDWKPPPQAAKVWAEMVALLAGLADGTGDLPSQVHRARVFYEPLLEMHYDHAAPRQRDLEQLEQIASRWRSRRRMLVELTLDPPASTQDLAGPPRLDDDYLVLSTIHSAKGLEWDAVYVIHAADGNIPSDMATSGPAEIEEERRLFYVALTRAKNWLYVFHPLRYYHFRTGRSDAHGMAQLTRFLPSSARKFFEQRSGTRFDEDEDHDSQADTSHAPFTTSRQVRRTARDLWR
jgi:DNA helicase II / ATP-dependent DNA helicase PcrA